MGERSTYRVDAARLPWRRVAPVARRRRHRRRGRGRRGARRRNRRAAERDARGRCRRAAAPSGSAAVDARARRPRRPRGGRAARAARLYADGKRVRGRPGVRALRLARGARRPGVRRVARRHRRPPEPARGAPSAEGRSSSSTSASRSSGRGSPAPRTRGGRRQPRSRTRPTRSPRATSSIRTTRAACRSSCTTAPLPGGLDRSRRPRSSSCCARRRRRAAGGKLLYGVALQRLGRQRSAARVFDAAAREASGERRGAGRRGRRPLRQGAAGGGVLAARPAHAAVPGPATVRFHLGLLLLWSGEVKEAKRTARACDTVEPGSPLAREASGTSTSSTRRASERGRFL